MELAGFDPYPSSEDEEKELLLNREWGDKVKGEEFDRRHLRWHENLEAQYAPHITYWDQKTVDKFKKLPEQPQIFFPVDLNEFASSLDAYQTCPLNPFEMRGDRPEMAIIAAGLPSDYIFYKDDKETVSDDAIREHLKKITLNWQDPEEIFFRSKVNGFVRETLPEQGPVVLSSLITFFARRHPEVVIPLMAARAVINGKTFLHSMILDRFGHKVPYLSDAERYAKLKRLTKPFFERTDDDELQDSVVLLGADEAKDWLATHRGITGKSLALVDKDHATARDIWRDKDEQEKILSGSVQKIYQFRQEIEAFTGDQLTSQNIDSFIDDVAKYLGSARIFGVGRTPFVPTVSAVTNNIPVLHTFVSKNVSEVVDRTVRAEWDARAKSGS